MKKIMFALCFMFGGIVTLTAQETQDTTSNQYRTETQSQYPQDIATQTQDRERIQATELPDEVKRSLEGEEYRGWLISGAFKSQGSESTGTDTTSTDSNREGTVNATGTEGEEVFIIELKNGAETKTVRFSSDGQKIEGMEEDQNSPNNQFNQNDQTDPTTPVDPATPATPGPPADPTQPSDPNATQPSDPNATQPADPNATQPTDPNATQPDQSQSPQPQSPDQSTSSPAPEAGTPTDQPRTSGPK